MLGDFLTFKSVFIVFSKQNLCLFIFSHQKSLKPTFKTIFFKYTIAIVICVGRYLESSKWKLCSKKTDVECGHLRFFDVRNVCTLIMSFLTWIFSHLGLTFNLDCFYLKVLCAGCRWWWSCGKLCWNGTVSTGKQ